MSQEVRYSAAQKKSLKVWEWRGAVATSRAVKMLRPQCGECQLGKDTLPEWWKTCTHDPYWSSQRKNRTVPTWVKNEETGEEELTDEVTTTRRVRVPNIVEVPQGTRNNDGKGPRKFHETKGFLTFPEAGFAPMCEAHGCGNAWPTIGTRAGAYCSEEHARNCIIDAEGVVTTPVYVSSDAPMSAINAAKNEVSI